MTRRNLILRCRIFVFAIAASAVLAAGCRKAKPVSIHERLRSYIDSIKVINTHEHQRWFPQYEGHALNFYTLLAHSYLQADLVSAGGPALTTEMINSGDLEAVWKAQGRFLDFCRNTSYYSQFVAGFRILYGYSEPFFTREGVQRLSGLIAENYRQREHWYEKAFAAAGFDVMFVDQYWDAFNTSLNPRFFALVFNINPLVTSIAKRSQLTSKEAPAAGNIYRLAEDEGHPIESLDDYLGAASRLLERFQAHDVVCLKNSLAYSRSLDFEDVSSERAKALFGRPSEKLADAERKALEDFMFHWIIEKAIALELPIQIHTGYLAGNGNVLENSRPTKLTSLFLRHRHAKFSLFHGGYPWTGEFAALGKMFPNVYLDLVWLPQISRESAVRSIDEMLDGVPYNKFFWGGDCHFIEESAGSLEFGRDVVAEVLALRVERGLMSEAVGQ
ncbi:MAG: amidohydrolase family protein, partial [Acidobacteriota bacterium]